MPRAFIISAGTSGRSTRLAKAPCIWWARGSARDGALGVTFLDPISFTTFKTRGAASANTQPTLTMSHLIAIGPPAIFRQKIRSTLGDQTFQKISCTTTRLETVGSD